MDLLQVLKDKCHRIMTTAETMDFSSSENILANDYAKLLKESVSITNSIRNDIFDKNIHLTRLVGTMEMIPSQIKIQDHITHIVFDELLPKRTKGYLLNERESIHQIYIKGLSDKLLSKNVLPYAEKVVMMIVHHFTKDSKMIDHDNFEAKPIIDSICAALFIDDSPKYVSYYLDHIIDSREFSEIYIIPEKNFIPFYTKHKDKEAE